MVTGHFDRSRLDLASADFSGMDGSAFWPLAKSRVIVHVVSVVDVVCVMHKIHFDLFQTSTSLLCFGGGLLDGNEGASAVFQNGQLCFLCVTKVAASKRSMGVCLCVVKRWQCGINRPALH